MSHCGVAVSDPRNAGVLAFLRPEDLSDGNVVRRRLSRAMPGAAAEKFEARLAKIMAAPNPPVPVSQPLPSISHPRYGGLGTHPDLIDRLLHLDATLPQRSGWVVYGSPALVHPETGIVFGFARGTLGYALRLPASACAEADQAGYRKAKKIGHQVDADMWDVGRAGPEWRLGAGSASEEAWCRAAYEAVG